MSKLRVSKEDGVNYYNYADETCGDVGTRCLPADGQNSVIYHKNSDKPFAYFYLRGRRWYKIKDDTEPGGIPPNVGTFRSNPLENYGYRRYNITTRNVDFNTNIKFYYTNAIEKFEEIPQGGGSVNICTTMKSEKIKDKLLFFTETVVQTPAACSIQGGKSKRKSNRKRQQRRTKRRQQKTKRRQRK